MALQNLVVFGDSIACGVTFDAVTARHTLCRDTYIRALRAQGVTVSSYAKPGCTTAIALEAARQASLPDSGTALIALGGNDSDLPWAEVSARPEDAHGALVSLEDYHNNLTALCALLRAGGLRPIVATPIPVVPDRYFDWFSARLDKEALLRHLGATEVIYRWQERYALEALIAAREADCPVINLRAKLLERRDFGALMSGDGIHPSAAGYALITRVMTEALAGLA